MERGRVVVVVYHVFVVAFHPKSGANSFSNNYNYSTMHVTPLPHLERMRILIIINHGGLLCFVRAALL